MRTFWRTRAARARTDRGAVLVEAAVAIPVLLLLAFGTLEFGMAWTTVNRVDSAVSSAARIGATSGSRTEADRDILVAIKSGLDSDSLANLDRVVVFRPADAAGSVPAGCIPAVGAGDSGQPNSSGTAGCNSYSGATVRGVQPTVMTGFGGGASDKDRFWKPSTRLDTILGPPDYIGVWVRTTYKNHTGTYWGDFTVTTSSVYRIQPDFSG